MRTEGECEDKEKECDVYVRLSVLVVFPTSLRNRGIEEGDYRFIVGGGGGGRIDRE